MEQEVELPQKHITLYGTLLVPDGAVKAATIIQPGSGPTDRDGNNTHGLRTDAYRQLAEALSAFNIATLRIDKRCIGKSTSSSVTEADLEFADYCHDLSKWKQFLFEQLGVPVYLIGHSEGALVSALSSQDHPQHVAGLILLCGTSQSGVAILREQLSRHPFPKQVEAMAILDALEQRQPLPPVPEELGALFRASVIPYLSSWIAINPRDVSGHISIPTLVVGGGKDKQVMPEDVTQLATSINDARYVLIPDMTHTLKTIDDHYDHDSTYTDPAAPLNSALVGTIAEFILMQQTNAQA